MDCRLRFTDRVMGGMEVHFCIGGSVKRAPIVYSLGIVKQTLSEASFMTPYFNDGSWTPKVLPGGKVIVSTSVVIAVTCFTLPCFCVPFRAIFCSG
jgi:hypothetical protein